MRYAIWNGLVSVDVEEVLAPADADEVVRIVERARAQGKRVKAVGAGHGFGDLALCTDLLVDMRGLDRILHVDPEQRLVRVQAGISLRALTRALERMGLALPNIGAWTEQTIAGALATATHGTSGRYRRTLMGSLEELTLVDGFGHVRVLRGEELRWLMLGYFGIVTEVVLRVVPLYYVRKESRVLDGVEALDSIPELLTRYDLVDLRWVGRVPQVLVRGWDIVEAGPSRRDRMAQRMERARLTMINGLLDVLRVSALPRSLAQGVFELLGRTFISQGTDRQYVSVYHEGLQFNARRLAPHEQHELALPMDRALSCLLVVRREMLADPTSVSIEAHVRFSPAVDVAMAPNGGRDTCWLNLSVFDPRTSAPLVERLVQLALEHGGRPHWGKIVPARMPALAELYGDLPWKWEQRRRSFDPEGLFLNDWYHRHVGLPPHTRPEHAERDE